MAFSNLGRPQGNPLVVDTPLRGESVYAVPGTYSWVCPAGVTSVSVVLVGAGAASPTVSNGHGGGGGALAYANNISVTPGKSYPIIVGSGNIPSSSGDSTAFGMTAEKGQSTSGATIPTAATWYGTAGTSRGGGNGGLGYAANNTNSKGGGGAGGYSGNGGTGGTGAGSPGPTAGTGGAGGGGWGENATSFGCPGGGVGLYGQGENGAAATTTHPAGYSGSGGDDTLTGSWDYKQMIAGRQFGGGGGWFTLSGNNPGIQGAGGAVRIVWPGITRQFPSTDVNTPY